MRSEQEMLALIVKTAESDERIRAVIMNGSRLNPNAPRDFFQDFDIVYFVTELAPFLERDSLSRLFLDKNGIIIVWNRFYDYDSHPEKHSYHPLWRSDDIMASNPATGSTGK